MEWLELSVDTEAAAVESVAAILHEHGEGGVAVYQRIVTDDDDAAFHYDTTQPTTVTTYVPKTDDGAQRRQRMEDAIAHLTVFNLAHITPLKSKTVAEEDWAHAWKRYFPPLRFGKHLVIKPSWRDFTAQSGDHVIELDPGMAFGTGLHQTTALCLELMEDYVSRGAIVLDQGTGSGILAIAAAKLGASNVVAVDNTEVAALAARDNVARNNALDVITVYLDDKIPVLPNGLYDVVIANIIANVIIALCGDMGAVLKIGGVALFSGIIKDRERDVVGAIEAAGFVVERRLYRDEWVALVARQAMATPCTTS